MYLKTVFLLATIALIKSEYVDYRNYKVYKITPENESEVNILAELEREQKYLFWNEQDIKVGREVNIQIAPEKQGEFEKFFFDANIKATKVVDNVQR